MREREGGAAKKKKINRAILLSGQRIARRPNGGPEERVQGLAGGWTFFDSC